MARKFGRYEVLAEIGEGAMGKVYQGFDPLTQRTLAIKALKDDVLARDVVDAVSGWRYEPPTKDGVPVRVEMRFRQSFRIGR